MDDNSRIKFMDDEDSTTSSEEEANVSIRSVAFDLPKKVADKIENHNNKPCQREKKVTPIPRQVSTLVCPGCLKITEKVSFNIASEASYVYILSGQKFIKNAKNGPIWRVFENLKLEVKQSYQTG